MTKSSLNDYSLTQITDLFVKALYEEDCNEKAFINNFELFVEETSVKIVSSNGIDVAYKNREVKGEFVTQCKHPVDVETYQNFAYDSLALENFKDLVRTALKMSEDRSLANVMPKAGNTNIILSDKYMKDFIGFYAGRADAAYIYQKYSNYEIGKDVQGNDTTGDRLNIQFGVSKPFSNEGVRMSKRPLLENGVVKTIHGGMRFCHYLGVEQIGTYEKVLLPAGRVSLDEMKKGPCLHIVNFSDFDMDVMSGHFEGEIRLGYYYDENQNVTLVTGGSVNGNIFEAQKNFVFSKEMQELDGYEGPKAVLIQNVPVAGE